MYDYINGRRKNLNMEDTKIISNRNLNIFEALIPIVALVALLAYNVYVYGDDALSGSNQFILLIGASIACLLYTSPSPRDRTRSRMPSSA